MPDAIVVGAGPNGLVAAITLAAAGWDVEVLEAASAPGGGTRSAELITPGVVHDVCSAIHPLGLASPAMRALPLADHGLRWVHPEVELAHPLDDGRAALLWLRRSVRLPLFVIGYSFGAHVGAHIMPADARGIILITPTLTHHDFAPAEHTPFNALVVVGQSDFATPLEHTMHWARSLPGSTSVRVLSGGGHFFRGIEPRVADACLSFIESTLTSMEPASCKPA